MFYSPFFILNFESERGHNPLSFEILTPDQLTLFPGMPSINALLVHDFAGFQSRFFGLKSLADIDIVDATRVPDADIVFSTQTVVEKVADLFGGFAGYARYANLPAALVLYDFSIPKCQTLIVCDIANGANIDSAIGNILHNNSPFSNQKLVGLD